MNRENLYIPLVLEHKKIISDSIESYKNKWKWSQFFDNKNNIHLEIWTWFGHFFARESGQNMYKNFIWMEIKYKRLYKTAQKTIEAWNQNFVLLKDFGQNIDKIFNENEISQTYVFFPDPWDNKDRQKKHKLFQTKFIRDLAFITKKWGKLIFKTDHLNYFNQTLDLFEENNDVWEKWFCSFDYEKDFEWFTKKNITEFESFYRWENIKINYVEFTKK